MGNHRLWGMRCYLSGAMDRVPDNGKQWRERITPYLEHLGTIVLNPCRKPIYLDPEMEERDNRINLKKTGQYDVLANNFRKIRGVDLRLTDMADFLIVNLDTEVHACGTYEEMGWANRMKKPILVRCAQGKEGTPDWIFGMIPHQHIFGTWKELKGYLHHIHSDNIVDDMRRWIFFDYSQLVPKISIEESEHAVDL